MLKFKDFQNKIELDEALKSVNVIKELPVTVKAICDKYGIKFEPLNINQTTLDVLGYSENYTDEFSDGKQDKIYNISNAMIESIKIIVHLIDDEVQNPLNYDWKDVIDKIYRYINKTKKKLYELYVNDKIYNYETIKRYLNNNVKYSFICHTIVDGSLPITFTINNNKLDKAILERIK